MNLIFSFFDLTYPFLHLASIACLAVFFAIFIIAKLRKSTSAARYARYAIISFIIVAALFATAFAVFSSEDYQNSRVELHLN